VELISGCLASGEFEPLQSVLTPECLKELKHRVSRFSMQQRQTLSVSKEDIYVAFIYQIGILMDDLPLKKSDSEEEGKLSFRQCSVRYTVSSYYTICRRHHCLCCGRLD
jgi:hypothetical protein